MTREAPDALASELGERLVVASNRLPVVLRRGGEGWSVEPGSGGLVTAMAPVLRSLGGLWVGWPGTVDVPAESLDEPLERAAAEAGYRFVPVPLSEEERDDYYSGFANEVLWPLLHDLQTRYRFDPAYWNAYRTVNERFAQVILEHADPGDYLWIHDYHLMGVAEALTGLGSEARTGYFLHTPFPAPDIYVKLPWRHELLAALLHYDLLGFQTLRDRRNFLSCVRLFFPRVAVEGQGTVLRCRTGDRQLRVGAFPISIDFQEFARLSESPEVEEHRRQIRESLPGRKIVLGVDRLDYTKGILAQLKAFRAALQQYPELRGRVSLVQVVVPSREHIQEYHDLKTEVERLVGEVNGQFGKGGWVPVHYLYRSLERPELVAYYRTADAALVTPLKDGMNLVAKEYCAASVDEEGVLILSEFAGAAAQLQDDALLINPYDIVSTAEAIRRALTMPEDERRARMSRLRKIVREQDIYWWLRHFTRAATAEELTGFPRLREYLPQAPAE